MKQQSVLTVQVAGNGETKNSAFAAALSKVQSVVLKSTGYVLLRIEPEDVKIIMAEEHSTTEKFLFFFLPREKKRYSVVLDITVSITMIDTEKVPFILR
ncbi:DUF4312 family protein [Acerihabitans sp. TG2]|uniref:DUF4312 family protein n=1 Tax=Acerihabitans sp. TG2 TaxID=3096008 RepID=UPI002B231B75|nr:DUF4312 family protein [Acerihabitans sp. TG2]MEA9390331.1 DUF4312 family protein [Acerihabitans sp. TG2]